MDKFLRSVFSMSMMALGLFLFLAAIAAATFIENDFGTPVAQKWVYKSDWFAGILLYLSLSLVYNIFRYQLFQLKKIGTLMFHLSLLVIIAGACTTRYFGYEGVMVIREGQSSNQVISRDTYLQIKVHDFNQQYRWDMPIILDTNVYDYSAEGTPDYSHNYFEHEFDFPGQQSPVKLEFVDLVPNIKDTIIPQPGGKAYLEIVTVGDAGRNYNYVESGKILTDGGIKIAFNNETESDAVRIRETDSGIYVMSPYDLGYFQMSDNSEGVVKRDSLQLFHTRRLYNLNGLSFVFSQYYPSAVVQAISSKENKDGYNGVKIRASQGDLSHEVLLRGGMGISPTFEFFQLGNLNYELAWGSKVTELPFSLYLRDFQFERYPGTDNPSSFASEITVIDHANGKQEEFRIYMNNVLDHQGYRFFQSNYTADEMGTILSVNYDAPGTNITYIGYLLLGLGFILNLFSPNSRFRHLIRKSGDLNSGKSALSILMFLVFMFVSGASRAELTKTIDAEHADKFAHLVIQDHQGRFKPVHTLALDLLRKVHRKDSYKGMTAMQVFLGIHTNNLEWNLEPIIAIPNSEIAKKLNLPEGEKYACLQDFISTEFTYLLEDDVKSAMSKEPSRQGKYDKDVLKVDERFNIVLGLFTGYYLKLFPDPADEKNTWHSPFEADLPFSPQDGEFVHNTMTLYLTGVEKGYSTGDWSQADKAIEFIDVFQRKLEDSELLPSKRKIEIEIFYNKLNAVKWLTYLYLLVALIPLFFNFIDLYTKKSGFRWVYYSCTVVSALGFLAMGTTLGLRWYISGHAPWSNGYEAIVFIAFVMVLAGIVFARFHKVILGAASLMTWLLLFVAQMSTMDPEITNLVPVLQSYWLMIHVAIITGSYAFLGLAAILALINMVSFLGLNENNKSNVLANSKQLTYVMEMTIIIGTFMLTIGTFLGGVWANESWGRYWGWDAKETWALVSVLTYAIILHFRFIPGLKGSFAFNSASLWGYSAIIMTFFGVNFYLSGLHSYAKGDPVPIPQWVPITVGILITLNVCSYIRYRLTFKQSHHGDSSL